MPNYIQYSTTIPSGSLKKGNVALGITNDVTGPTLTTGWYTGINPPTGSYSIYEVSSSGDPDIFCPINENELINLVRSKGATGGNTGSVAAALAWISTQNNLLATNKVYPDIVTSGSVFYVDAGFVGSYSVTGSTWYDLSGYANNGTLINGPSFNPNGYIVFDGVDDYVSVPNTSSLQITEQITLGSWFKLSSSATGQPTIILKETYISATNNSGYLLRNTRSNNSIYIALFNDFISTAGTPTNSINLDTWYYACGTYDGSQIKMYLNGTLQATTNYSGGIKANTSTLYIGQPSAGFRMNGNVAVTQIYNRALSQAEILQNYYQAPIVTDGLVFAVDAGNLVSYESGSTTTYSLTGSYTGSLQNGVAFLPDNGGVWNFDGVDDIIRSQNINPPEISIEVWKKWTIISDDWLITNTTTTVTDTTKGYYMRIDFPSTTFTAYFGVGSTSRGVTYTPTLLNKWTHVVATYDPVTEGAKLYWDGVLVNTNTGTGAIDYTGIQGLTIGAANDLSRATPGPVGPVRIYNRALSATEVAQNFNAQRNRFGI